MDSQNPQPEMPYDQAPPPTQNISGTDDMAPPVMNERMDGTTPPVAATPPQLKPLRVIVFAIITVAIILMVFLSIKALLGGGKKSVAPTPAPTEEVTPALSPSPSPSLLGRDAQIGQQVTRNYILAVANPAPGAKQDAAKALKYVSPSFQAKIKEQYQGNPFLAIQIPRPAKFDVAIGQSGATASEMDVRVGFTENGSDTVRIFNLVKVSDGNWKINGITQG